ncbi:MAG: diacylglycerol kinase family lipid kinase [Verrucomicrobia bacterium]|nr:diacylglycerol kinase family lipid kinase [Verrucomicrobiota bacterium]
MTDVSLKRVLVLINRRSGLWWSFDQMRRALDREWDVGGTDLFYQFCQNVDDGVRKAKRAVAEGVDTILVVGGDGTVNTIGRTLIGTDVTLGIIPVGSGNGFARHFEIPLTPEKAVSALAKGSVRRIDVGYVNEHPFLVTASMAWEAALTETFAKSPVRGILPYVFAGVQELIDYTPQDFTIVVDDGAPIVFKRPMICTVANLSEYGGGAKIAPQAQPDDGYLELVVALREDAPKLIANLRRLFDGTLSHVPEIRMQRFKKLEVRRESAAPIQVDGEPTESGESVTVAVRPACLNVLVPREGARS